MIIKLSESDRSLVSLSLRIAGQQYWSNAEYCANGIKDARLAEQFERQSTQALEIARLIDDCEDVAISVEDIGVDAPGGSK